MKLLRIEFLITEPHRQDSMKKVLHFNRKLRFECLYRNDKNAGVSSLYPAGVSWFRDL